MNSKYVLLYIFLILLPIQLFAQRVNEHGLKMVSEVKLYNLEDGIQ